MGFREMLSAQTSVTAVFMTVALCACGEDLSDVASGEAANRPVLEEESPDPEVDPNLIGGLQWPGVGWKHTDGETLGLDPRGIEGARDYAFGPGRNTQALLIVYQGQLVGEWYAQGYNKTSMVTSWSIAKSFMSILFGIALDQGLYASLDEPVGPWIPEWADDPRGDITIRQLLQMQSGLDSSNEDIFSAAHQLAYSLDRELLEQPSWDYANCDSMVLGRVLEMIVGEEFIAYATTELFDPIGMTSANWWTDASGQAMSYCCIDATPRDFARFGIMAARMGQWRGLEVVSSAFLEESYTPQPTAPWYGLHWWTFNQSRSYVVNAIGYDEQHIFVFPDNDLVVLRFSRYRHVGGSSYQLGFSNYMSTEESDNWSSGQFLTHIDTMLFKK